MVSAPRRAAAVAKLMRVRVEGSKKRDGHGLAAQGGQFFQGMALKFLKGLGLIENKTDLLACEVLRCRASVTNAAALISLFGAARRRLSRGRLGDAVHDHNAFLAIDFLKADFHHFRVASLYRSADEGGFDGQLAMSAVHQHAEANAPGRPRSKRPFIAARIVRPV